MGWGGRWGYLFASYKRTESVYQFSSNRTESLRSVLSVREFFFFKMQFMPSRQRRAVRGQIFILQVTSTIIIVFEFPST